MANFVLIYSGGATPEGMQEEDRKAVMDAWGAWYGRMGAAIVDGGNPFGASRTVSAKGAIDGPASSPPATGYTVISADSLDAAVASVEGHPHLDAGGKVSVYEALQM